MWQASCLRICISFHLVCIFSLASSTWMYFQWFKHSHYISFSPLHKKLRTCAMRLRPHPASLCAAALSPSDRSSGRALREEGFFGSLYFPSPFHGYCVPTSLPSSFKLNRSIIRCLKSVSYGCCIYSLRPCRYFR
jgi:hypothetical protein